jgi:hypothetical protein
VAQQDKAAALQERSLSEMTMKRVTIPKDEFDEDGEQGGKKRKRSKVVRQSFAVGGLDQDFSNWNGGGEGPKLSKKKQRTEDHHAKFTEFDAAKKLRKGGKVQGSFKSKAKFKRR